MSIEVEELEDDRARTSRVVIEMGRTRVVHYIGLGRNLTMCLLENKHKSPPESWDLCHGTDEQLSCPVCEEIHKTKLSSTAPYE